MQRVRCRSLLQRMLFAEMHVVLLLHIRLTGLGPCEECVASLCTWQQCGRRICRTSAKSGVMRAERNCSLCTQMAKRHGR